MLGLDAFLQPLLLLRLQDVGVLDAGVAAVRVAQYREHVAQLHVLLALESRDLEFAVQVPQGQAVAEHVQVGMATEAGFVQAQRIGVGHEVAPIAVCRNEFQHAGVLVDDRVGVVDAPAHRLIGDAQLPEDVVEEIVGE